MTDVKICGISTSEALDAAVGGGASHIGLVFFAKSPRNVAVEKAGALAQRAAGRVKVVGLFVDPTPEQVDAVRQTVRLDAIQLHGDEHPALVGRMQMQHGIDVWKAIPVRTASDLAASHRYRGHRIVFDAKPPAGTSIPGGNGLRFDWSLLDGFRHTSPWALSGGLDTRNVAEAIRRTGAPLVDVSSGVESESGVKDVDKIAAFLKATRV